ncbi:hypothetical protein [Amycolatopsis sp. NPDC004079]|uniref:hypothetical protein n=1 Tax=Amycolatopsis sp. NPDC004079 TaxID=3154549 RepID=UPI0033B7CCDB
MHASETRVFEPGDNVVSVHEEIPVPQRERGKVVCPLEPSKADGPRYSVKWEGCTEPIDELARELLPAQKQ